LRGEKGRTSPGNDKPGEGSTKQLEKKNRRGQSRLQGKRRFSTTSEKQGSKVKENKRDWEGRETRKKEDGCLR